MQAAVVSLSIAAFALTAALFLLVIEVVTMQSQLEALLEELRPLQASQPVEK